MRRLAQLALAVVLTGCAPDGDEDAISAATALPIEVLGAPGAAVAVTIDVPGDVASAPGAALALTVHNVVEADAAYVVVNDAAPIDLAAPGLRRTQLHEACDGGDEEDPADPDCLRVWLRFVDPVFPPGVLPFDFGQTFNRYSTWEVRGFSSPDFPDLPADFDLYRADNQVEGGAYFAPFDAWLVPR